MLNNNLHRLLKRQLKKTNLGAYGNEQLTEFLNMVDQAYKSFDKDVNHIENILEESSKELFRANQQLKVESASTKAQLVNIMNSVQGVLFETNTEGDFIYLNKAWEDLMGLKIKDSIGKNFSDLLKERNEKELVAIRRFLSKKQSKYQRVFKYITPQNEVKWIKMNLKLSKYIDGQISGAIGTMIDITSLKETELKLNQANKAKNEFLSMISHEIRTPLNAVIGLSNVLLMEQFLPNQFENLTALKYSGEHLLLLINDVLDFNKIESNTVEFEDYKFDLNEFLRNIKYHFKLLAKEKDLDFRIEKEIKVPNILIGDKLKLSQIIKNLLSNAFKFTEKGSVVLYVEYLGSSTDKHSISFKVSDTGIGIPLDKHEYIFKKFTQARKNTTRLYGGTGLGLAISKKLLNLQGSELQLVSEPNKGSTFWFNLDFKIANSAIDCLDTKAAPAGAPLKLKVLVAEDNDINTLVLKKMLDKWNVEYTMTKNGKELIKVYNKEDFDLILMDLQMPVMDGYQATATIRGMSKIEKAMIPIIALSAFSQEEVKEEAKAYKMDGYMTKPFNPNELYELLSFYSNKKAERLIG